VAPPAEPLPDTDVDDVHRDPNESRGNKGRGKSEDKHGGRDKDRGKDCKDKGDRGRRND
jgi:hypothetical protein